MKVPALVRVTACALTLQAGASFAASAASATSAASDPVSQQPYSAASGQIRFGNAALFRNLIPSATLEQQSADEYLQILHEARRTKHLLGDDNALVKRGRDIANREIPFALKWNERSKNWNWQVNVVRSNEIRMYCLPGGKIVIYSGLIEQLRLNDNELGMMIGHEIAHALREHARDRLGRQQAAQLTTGTIPPLFGFADITSAPLGIGEQLLAMRYTPADETEADVIGSEIASRAGYDPRAAVTLWKKIDSATRRTPNGFIWMHPFGADRVHDLMKRLPDMMPLYAKALGRTVDQLPNYAGMGRFKKPRS
jgi:predicted Zn-dependent protease